jgi:hypothetical protein
MPFIEIAEVWIGHAGVNNWILFIRLDGIDGTFTAKFNSFHRWFSIHRLSSHVHFIFPITNWIRFSEWYSWRYTW